MKASDYSCLPICARHHIAGYSGSYHDLGKVDFEERYALDLSAAARELRANYDVLRRA